MKKALSMALVLMMVLAIFAGCASKPVETPLPSAAPSVGIGADSKNDENPSSTAGTGEKKAIDVYKRQVQYCNMTPVAESIGVNRICPSTSIKYPFGAPDLPAAEEKEARVEMLREALDLLTK